MEKQTVRLVRQVTTFTIDLYAYTYICVYIIKRNQKKKLKTEIIIKVTTTKVPKHSKTQLEGSE